MDSELGAGTTFEIYLPPCASAWTRRRRQASARRRDAAAGTVLLVEDEPAVRAVARRVLEGAGYLVIEAPDGRDCAARSRRRAPGPIHLLMTDVVMPGMGGLEPRGELPGRRSTTRVLFASGHAYEAEENG